jgi:hypothetical protein
VLTVVERRDGELTGITVLSRTGVDTPGGAAVLVPAELEVDGRTLADWGAGGGADGDAAAVAALAGALRLALGDPVTLDDDGWVEVLGDRTVAVANPDPVLVDGARRFAPGALELGAGEAADWLGQLGNQQPSALLYRRLLWWEALLAAPVEASAPGTGAGATGAAGGPAATIADIAAGAHVVELLPVDQTDGALVLAAEAAEELVVDVVPFPAGSRPGDRPRVRVLDRTGGAALPEVARQVAQAGGEVVVVGYARAFDGAATEAVIASTEHDEAARRLIERMGTGTVSLSPGSDDTIDVTVLAGPDLQGRQPG